MKELRVLGVGPKYTILGNGRWAGVIHRILAHDRQVAIVGQTRRREGESVDEYQRRIASSLAETGATVAWICVPSGPNTPVLAEAAIDSGMHVIVEKPWRSGKPAGQLLMAQAHARGLLIGVHFEYCLLDGVEAWRHDQRLGTELRFSGRFTTSRPNRLGIPPLENLGSHLFAIHLYAVPEAAISQIYCGYEEVDERIISIEDDSHPVAAIDFTFNREPIIQRFIARFESGLEGNPFPFTLDFAAEVSEALAAYRKSVQQG